MSPSIDVCAWRSGKGVGGGPVVGQLNGGSMPAGVAVLAFLGGGGYLGGGGKGKRPDIPGTAGKARLAPKAGGSCNCCCLETSEGRPGHPTCPPCPAVARAMGEALALVGFLSSQPLGCRAS